MLETVASDAETIQENGTKLPGPKKPPEGELNDLKIDIQYLWNVYRALPHQSGR
jgi:hypothetical protein